MTRRSWALFAVLLLLAAGVGLWRLRRPADMLPAPPQRGAEALDQLYGPRDGGADASSDAAGPAVRPDTLLGQVVLPNGEPATHAVVTLTSADGSAPMTSHADAGGMFAFAPLDAGQRVAVEASLDGYGPAIAVGLAPGQPVVRLVLAAGRRVHGLVMEGDEPVSGATVHLGGPGMFPQRSVTADASGRFQVSGLRPGQYEIYAAAPRLGSGFGVRAAIDDSSAEDLPIDVPVFVAPTVELQIIDTGSGDLVPLAVVTVAAGPLHVLALSSVAEGGRVSVDYLPRGSYFTRVRAPGYLPYEGTLRVAGDGPVEVRLSAGAAVAGVIRDRAGNAIAGARLSVIVEGPRQERWEVRAAPFEEFHRLVRPDGLAFWPQASPYASGPGGAFELAGLPPGTGRVVASAEGFAVAVSNPIVLAVDQTYVPVDLVLDASRRVRGRVEDGGGGALDGAVVSARHPLLPQWAESAIVTTRSDGLFEFSGIGDAVTLTVRHVDFAPAEVPLEVRPEGLDGVIVRLAGRQSTQGSGRLFTSRGSPAVGALVWLMSGASPLPVCQATVGADGWFRAANCTSRPDRIVASFPEHAPLLAELGGGLEPRDWDLALGGELEVLSQRAAVVVSVEPTFALPAAHWPPRQLSLQRWSRERLRFLTPGTYRIRCAADGFGEGVVDVVVADGVRAEATCPIVPRLVEFPLVVVDPQGAPVPGAIVWVDRVDPPLRAIADASGRVTVRAQPGVWLDGEAMHERWGRGFLRFYAYYEPRTDPDRIVLNEPIGGDAPEEMVRLLSEWGVASQADGRTIVIDRPLDGTPAAGVGLRRLDSLLWARPLSAFRLSLGVRRDGELLTFDLVREPQ